MILNYKKTYLDKLLINFNKPETPHSNPQNHYVLPATTTNTYDLTKILSRKKSITLATIPKLQYEIKTLESELQTLKQAHQKDLTFLQDLLSKIEKQSNTKYESEDQINESRALTNIKHIPDDFLNVLTQISSKTYLIKITLVFSNDFKIDNIALFDTGAYLSYVKEGVVPK